MNMRPGPGSRPRCRGAFALALTLMALPAAAQVGPLTYQNLFFDQATNAHSGNYLAVDAGLIYTDNATFTGNGSGETLAEIGMVGNISEVGTRLDYHLDSDIAALKYLSGSYPLEPTGYLDAIGDYKIVPGLFSWIGRETYTELVIDPYAPVNPDNLENLNTISTGPRFTLRPTLRTTVTVDGVYSYINSQSPSPLYVNIDNHRYGGDVKIERAFNSFSSLFLDGVYEKVDFNDQAINNNYSVANGIAGYKLAGERTVLDVSGGYTQLRELNVLTSVDTVVGIVQRRVTETFNIPNWSLSLSRVITPDQRVALSASQQVLDAATLLQIDIDQAVPSLVPPQVAVGDPLTYRTYSANWRFQTWRTTFEIGLLEMNERFQLDPARDLTFRGANAFLERKLSPVLNWDIGVQFEHQDLAGARSTNGTTEMTDLRWRIGGRVALRFLYSHTTFFGVSDNQVGVLVSYVLIGAGGGATPAEPNPTLAPSPYGLQPIAPMSTLSPPR
jgi:hypothetical protein